MKETDIYYWRVTKYNPAYRNKNRYLRDEWTSISDVGKSFDGVEVTLESYLDYEGKYIHAILLAMQESEIERFRIDGLEKNGYYVEYDDFSEPETRAFYDVLKDGMLVHGDEISTLAKLILREVVWGKLADNGSFVHFGYDYYMYFGFPSKLEKTRARMENTGVFFERMRSPYLE